jgi:hypothetical protein
MRFLRWLFGSNVRKPHSVIYVDRDGVSFTVGGMLALISTLRKSNRGLEDDIHRLTTANLAFQKELYRKEQLLRAYEETAWKPPTPQAAEKWWHHECFKRVKVEDA